MRHLAPGKVAAASSSSCIHALVRISQILPRQRFLPLLLGFLLITAGIAKAYQIVSRPLIERSHLSPEHWGRVGLVELEVGFGLWLWFGVFSPHTRTLAIALFCVFLGVNLYQGLRGKESCGCFGNVPVSPWLTATLDIAAIVALCLWRPRHYEPVLQVARRRLMRLGFAFGIVLASVALTAATLPSKPAQIGEDGLISGQGVVLLEPPTWLGKRLPLLPYIEAPEDLGAGTWVLILIHPDCPKCQAVLATYAEMARDWEKRGLSSRIAVVVVPVKRAIHTRNIDAIWQRESFCTLGHLSDDREWFVETPTLIKIIEGMVVEATAL